MISYVCCFAFLSNSKYLQLVSKSVCNKSRLVGCSGIFQFCVVILGDVMELPCKLGAFTRTDFI